MNKRILLNLLALLLCALQANAERVKIGELYYELNGTTATAAVTYDKHISYKNYELLTNITIPESVVYKGNAYTVTSLGEGCFQRCSSLKSIEIPSSVTSLGEYCFEVCTSLTSIEIPSSVISMAKYCFYYCTSLTSIEIPPSVSSIGYGCFNECTSLTSIEIPSSVNSIGDACFGHCSSLTSIVIPSSVTELPRGCFDFCSSLTSIEIPSSVNSIGEECFYYCSSLTSIEIPSSVTKLDGWCFGNCSSLTSIEIPSSVTKLGGHCFCGCSSLNSLVVKALVPPSSEDAYITFDDEEVVSNCVLYVPDESIETYRGTFPWSKFFSIKGISGSDGIEGVAADSEAPVFYNLKGVRVDNPDKGVYIRVTGNKTDKVIR